MLLYEKLQPECVKLLKSIPALIDRTFPIPARFRSSLPSQIAALSRLLTNSRGERPDSYLGRPGTLSAYLYYFMQWNLYRLCLILQCAEIILSSGDTVVDLGSGPLTFVSALWIARPDLRAVPLDIFCADLCAPALKAGKKFFAALTGGSCPWKIRLIHEDFKNYSHKNKKASFVCAANVFNEMYEKIPHHNAEKLKRQAAFAAQLMHNMALPSSLILTAEPGVPQSGRFISFLREAFIGLNRFPLLPCTHADECPLCKGAKRWCHFAFETADAPNELHKLSAAAGIPKERLVLSFLLTGTQAQSPGAAKQDGGQIAVRVVSDAFPLPDGRFGRYGCCSRGLVLLAGEKTRVEKIGPAGIVRITGNPAPRGAQAEGSAVFTGRRDKKSGAPILEVK